MKSNKNDLFDFGNTKDQFSASDTGILKKRVKPGSYWGLVIEHWVPMAVSGQEVSG